MTKLFAYFSALLIPPALVRKPSAEVVFESLHRFLASTRTHARDAVAVLQAWAAMAVDPSSPLPGTAPLLATRMGSAAPAAGPVRHVWSPLAAAGRRIVDDAESRFVDRWPEPGHARMAAGLFVGSLALACAGIVGVVTVAAPLPPVHLQRLAGLEPEATASLASAGPGAVVVPAPQAAASAPPTTAAAPAPTPAPAAPVAPAPASSTAAAPPAGRGALPIGKGMWIWMHDRADGGDPNTIVARAKANGLTHLYVRTGTLREGFMAGPFLDALLPVAHANGIRVYGWDFPYLNAPGDDVLRALAAIKYTTPDGHRIDGFSADIESTHEGTNNDLEFVTAYVNWLRQNVGPNYPLIATVPNPTPGKVKSGFPYREIVAPFDAVAPMVYWMNRDPASDAANAVSYLSQFGKPVFPIGQAYDGGPEGGPPGVPNRDALIRFMQYADAVGAAGVSFWSYQHATPEAWDAVRDAAEFRLDLGDENGAGLSPGMVRAYQTALSGIGFQVGVDGVWGPSTVEAVRNYQAAARLPVTGKIDQATHDFLVAPVAAPIQPD
jgi:hypothetical protein